VDDTAALVSRSRQGDREAFSTLVVRLQDVVYNLCYQRLSDAEAALDAAQEAFVKAFAALESYRGEASFKSWVCAIALREAENQRRKRVRQLPATALVDQDPRDGGPPPDASLESQDEVALVRRTLTEVDEEDAQLILLRDIENLSYLEIAEALGVPLGTVKSGLNRARARLKVALERNGAGGRERVRASAVRAGQAG
jgi:RNA polymerase sigma-70 factor (ECF subfamily)